jgi:hypothetical protein
MAGEVYGEERCGDIVLLDQVLEELRLAGLCDGPKRHPDETLLAKLNIRCSLYSTVDARTAVA